MIIGYHINCIFIPQVLGLKKNFLYRKSIVFDFLSKDGKKKIIWPQTMNINCGLSLRLYLEENINYYYYFEPIIWIGNTTVIIENLCGNVWSLVSGLRFGYNFILCRQLNVNVNMGFGYRYVFLETEVPDGIIPYCLGSFLGISSGESLQKYVF